MEIWKYLYFLPQVAFEDLEILLLFTAQKFPSLPTVGGLWLKWKLSVPVSYHFSKIQIIVDCI
jgi:hypothetical protein